MDSALLTGRTLWIRRSLLALAAFSAGCGGSQSQTSSDTPKSPSGAAVQAAEQKPRSANPAQPGGTEELWMACFLNNAKVGYMHTKIVPVQDPSGARLQYAYDDELVLRRFNETTKVRTKLSSLETLEGRLIEFRTELQTGPGKVVTEGYCRDNQLVLETEAEGKKKSDRIPWSREYGGFLADRLSLRQQPMKPRERRRLQAILPVLLQVGQIQLEAIGYEAVQLPSASRQLLRIDVTTAFGKTQMKSILWTDETGEALKVRDTQIGLEAFLTSREIALGANAVASLDLGEALLVQVARRLEDPHHTQRIVYRARLKDGDVHSLFAVGTGQSVRRLDERTAEVTVQAVRPGKPATAGKAPADRPTAADSAATPLIQSDDQRVMEMASKVAPGEPDPWKLALALERHVKQSIRLKNYTTALATAAEVAKSLEGDCTEHAVLLAGLCRARQLPARVAVGLVYYRPASAFAYHMWTEVWIQDGWVPLDATLGLGGTGAAHLRLVSTNLSGTTAYADLMPVVQALGKLQLEIVSVE